MLTSDFATHHKISKPGLDESEFLAAALRGRSSNYQIISNHRRRSFQSWHDLRRQRLRVFQTKKM
jgi:hypothetical protein